MFKKVLCSSLLILGLSQVAWADDFDANNDAAPVSDSAPASLYNPGIYLGAQLGMTNLHYSGSEYTIPGSSYDNKYHFGGRGFVGYAFSQYISTELGYTYYGRPKFQCTTGDTQDILQQGMDLVVKANLPLDYGFSFYIKGGLAWVYRSALHYNTGHFAEKDSNSKYPLVGALGVSYWFAPNIALDLSWTKTMSISSLPTTDLLGLGIIYKINL